MSEQVDWCVATRHLTGEATKPGATLHVSMMFRPFHKTCVRAGGLVHDHKTSDRRGYETRTHRTCVCSSTRHLSLVLGERCPQDMCLRKRTSADLWICHKTCAVFSRINKTSVQKIDPQHICRKKPVSTAHLTLSLFNYTEDWMNLL